MKKIYEKPQITIEKFSITDYTANLITISNTIFNADCLNDNYTFVYDNNY